MSKDQFDHPKTFVETEQIDDSDSGGFYDPEDHTYAPKVTIGQDGEDDYSS